jgi:hypothetical protein
MYDKRVDYTTHLRLDGNIIGQQRDSPTMPLWGDAGGVVLAHVLVKHPALTVVGCLVILKVPIAELICANQPPGGALLKESNEETAISEHTQPVHWALDVSNLLGFGDYF